MNGEIESYDQAGSVKTVHRDAAGRIIEIGDNLRADLIQSFKYDNFDHLSEYRVGSSAALERKFTYDAEGNRKTVELAGKVFTYTYAPGTNYLVSAPGPVARQWAVLDANAKTFTDGTNVFTLDSYRRISSVKNAKGSTTYLRDYTGRRVSKKFSDGSAVHYVHDADGHLIAEVDGAGATLVEYIWLDDTPVAVLQNGVLYYVYTDHLNTPRAVTDTANTIRWTWHSEPFGSSLPNESPSGVAAFKLNLRFPGQYYDVESGLHYNYFRDYDPQTGRYVQSDPIGLEGGINTYAYVGGNPLSFVDSLGLITEVIISDSRIWSDGSQFGHVAISINGTVYSRAHSTYFTTTLGDYLSRQEYRDSIGLVLNTTPAEEEKMKALLDKRVKENAPYSLYSNSCSSNVADALEKIGIETRGPWQTGDALGPFDILNNLPKSGRVIKTNWYGKTH